ncbi:hypothetical protein BC939DRAFT_193307 [Gamsiella multidivaricata]|uniref:uncharacterized protein n=1 Tax=Gamsiella multidivaricata TaxID=101098 RepID=UPI00221F609B|nr:uncharacterized protein BC939DRAFT_193307 [Gamsiella multidivaricata]KAI7822194.1 hypothetical protein BC939DRAFT_193307 [Gamsiella multidivaricata]
MRRPADDLVDVLNSVKPFRKSSGLLALSSNHMRPSALRAIGRLSALGFLSRCINNPPRRVYHRLCFSHSVLVHHRSCHGRKASKERIRLCKAFLQEQ